MPVVVEHDYGSKEAENAVVEACFVCDGGRNFLDEPDGVIADKPDKPAPEAGKRGKVGLPVAAHEFINDVKKVCV